MEKVAVSMDNMADISEPQVEQTNQMSRKINKFISPINVFQIAFFPLKLKKMMRKHEFIDLIAHLA